MKTLLAIVTLLAILGITVAWSIYAWNQTASSAAC